MIGCGRALDCIVSIKPLIFSCMAMIHTVVVVVDLVHDLIVIALFVTRVIMGMFDSVWVECACDKKVEFQTKSGPCVLHDYNVNQGDDIPEGIGDSLDGTVRECECGRIITLTFIPPAIKGYFMVKIEEA